MRIFKYFQRKNRKQHAIKNCKKKWLRNVKNPEEIAQKLLEKQLLPQRQIDKIQRKSSTAKQNEVLFSILYDFESEHLQALCVILTEFEDPGLDAVAKKIGDIILISLSTLQGLDKRDEDLSQAEQERPAAGGGGELAMSTSSSVLYKDLYER